ncbi:MAG: TetR/AcrR family transcriptional regulator [Chloroflexota bacterium]
MPYPAQITRELVIDKACALIEAEGLDQVSLSRLAAALNVKAPSLYRYFDGKGELLRAVNAATGHLLIASISEAVAVAQSAREQVIAMAFAYRAFAHRFPVTFGLLFSDLTADLRPDAAQSEQWVLPLQAVMAELAGESESLAALRGAMALAHGYVTLELNGQFRRGGDLDTTFARIVEAYINGWQ